MADQDYYAHAHRMIKTIVDHFSHQYFVGKKILDLGAYKGLVAGALLRMGAEVVCVDARQEHLDHIAKTFPGIKTIRADLDYKLPFIDERFDMVLSLGVMCHLKNWTKHLYDITSMSETIVLETEVWDSNHITETAIFEDKHLDHQSYNGEVSIVPSINIQSTLKELGASFKRLDKKYLNTNSYKYDWQETDSNTRKSDRRRFWFINQSTILKRVFESSAQIKEFRPNIQSVSAPPQPERRQGPRERIRMMHKKIDGQIETYSKQSLAKTIATSKIFTDIGQIKVAVVISGHLRTFERTYKSFVKQILDDDSSIADVFVHTWDKLDGAKGFDGASSPPVVMTETKLTAISNILKPKKMVIDTDAVKGEIQEYIAKVKLTDAEKQCFYGGHLLDYCSMLYSMKSAWSLVEQTQIETGIQYDMVIRLRPDIIFIEKLKQSIIPLNNGICNTPNMAQYFSNGMNDQLAFGTPTVMRAYMSMYDNIINYVCGRVCKPMHPETLLRYHLAKNNIAINNIQYKYYVLRGNGSFLVSDGNRQKMVNDQRLLAGHL